MSILHNVPEIKFYDSETSKTVKRMYENMPPIEIFKKVSDSFPVVCDSQGLPFANQQTEWRHGSIRITGMIGGYDAWSVENGTAPCNIDLSDVKYIAFYRQAVRNNNSHQIKFFYSSVPYGSYGEAQPGQVVDALNAIPFDWNVDDLEAMAQKSFEKLQEMVVEFCNSEPNGNV